MPYFKLSAGVITALLVLPFGCDRSAEAPPAVDSTSSTAEAATAKPSSAAAKTDPVQEPHVEHRAEPLAKSTPNEKPIWVKMGEKPKSVELLLIATFDGTNHGMNFNGFDRGKASFTVPLGWTVNVKFVNNSAVPHSAVVVETDMVRYPRVGEPYFEGAATPNYEMGTTSQTVNFKFVPDEKGRFAIACGFPAHAAGGHWIGLVVGDENAKPSFNPTPKNTE